MKSAWIDDTICYTGTELRSRWISEHTGVKGDAIVSFAGPADVPIENMVDMEDVANNEPIFSKSMLHFIIEHEGCDLALAVARQRLLVAITSDILTEYESASNVIRKGDDIYDGDRKLSVSIATSSPVSCLIHFALNISSDGTPLPTKGLADYGIETKVLAGRIMDAYLREINDMETARHKVRAVM